MKFAFSTGAGHSDHADVARRMAEAMALEEEQQFSVVEFEQGAVGIVTRPGCESKLAMLRRSPGGNVLAVAGVPVKEGRLEDILAGAVELPDAEAARSLRELDGAFAAMLWNAEAGALHIVTDFAGIQPLYWMHDGGRLAFASEIKAFSLAGLCAPEPDAAGWGAFIAFGHTISDATQLTGVRRVRGQMFRYNPATDELTQEFWWKPPSDIRGIPLAKADIDGIVETVSHNVRGYAEHADRSTIMLSAGFDSRFILCVLKRNGLRADALNVQFRGHFLGSEGRLARRIGLRMGVGTVRVVHPPEKYYDQPNYLRYLIRNEVATPSLSLFIAKVAEMLDPSMGAAWDGLSLGMSLSPWIFHGFKHYLASKAVDRDARPWRTARRVFTQDAVDAMHGAYTDALRREVQGYPDNPYGVALFMYRNRSANRTAPNPLKVFANRVLPFVPGTDRRIWVLNAPYLTQADWEEHQLYRRIYSEVFPEAYTVPFCSEAGVLPGNRATAETWCTNRLHLAKYYWNRIRMLPGMAKLLAHRPSNPLLQAVLNTAPIDHPSLDADGAREIVRWRAREDNVVRAARRLLFYWQAWRLIMGGELTSQNAEEFLAGACGR